MSKKEEKKESKESTTVAMYPSLKERIQNAANNEGRSFSDYVCRILDKQVD